MNILILKALRRQDPAGWESTEPTPQDYADFTAWVIRTYGHETWVAYCQNRDKQVTF